MVRVCIVCVWANSCSFRIVCCSKRQNRPLQRASACSYRSSHCGVKWTFSGDDFWRRKELPSLFSCTITCKMLWIACVPSVLSQYGRKQRSLQQLMTLPPPRCGGRIYIVVFAGAFFLRRKNGINLLPLFFSSPLTKNHAAHVSTLCAAMLQGSPQAFCARACVQSLPPPGSVGSQ